MSTSIHDANKQLYIDFQAQNDQPTGKSIVDIQRELRTTYLVAQGEDPIQAAIDAAKALPYLGTGAISPQGNAATTAQRNILYSGHAATGGGIYGSGGPTEDNIPMMLSAGGCWTAQEVANAGGHSAMEKMRSMFRGMAAGGPVLNAKFMVDFAQMKLIDLLKQHATVATGVGGGSGDNTIPIGSWSGQQGGLSPSAARRRPRR